MAIDRIIHQDYDIDADTMIIVSTIGVVMNIAMGAILHGGLCNKLSLVHHGHSHGIGGGSHGHSHGSGHSHANRHGHSHMEDHGGHGHSHSSRNMNVRAALIHVIGDLVQSIGVLIAAILIKYWVHILNNFGPIFNFFIYSNFSAKFSLGRSNLYIPFFWTRTDHNHWVNS